jgi:hypothetical protein
MRFEISLLLQNLAKAVQEMKMPDTVCMNSGTHQADNKILTVLRGRGRPAQKSPT